MCTVQCFLLLCWFGLSAALSSAVLSYLFSFSYSFLFGGGGGRGSGHNILWYGEFRAFWDFGSEIQNPQNPKTSCYFFERSFSRFFFLNFNQTVFLYSLTSVGLEQRKKTKCWQHACIVWRIVRYCTKGRMWKYLLIDRVWARLIVFLVSLAA